MNNWVGARGAALACALAFAACGSDEHVDDYGGVVDLSSQYDGGVAPTLVPKAGYVAGQRMEYYDFGEARAEQNSKGAVVGAPTAYMYWFFDRDTYDRGAQMGQPLYGLKVDDQGHPVLADGLASLDDPDNPCLGPVQN